MNTLFYKPAERLGVGINYRNEIGRDILKHIRNIDCIEIYTEKFFIQDHDITFEKIVKQLPILLHGLDLSIGSSNEIDPKYLKNLSSVLERIEHHWFSEHISLTKEGEVEVGHLMPVQFSQEIADRIINKAIQIQSLSKKPFLLENITYYYALPGSTMGEPKFINYILEQADCGLLLDVNNLYINSVNHKYDPHKFLDQIDLDRVVEIHMAGGTYKYNMLIDTHAHSISPQVWALCEEVVKRTPLNCLIIERDGNLPDFSELVNELDMARSIMQKYGRCN